MKNIHILLAMTLCLSNLNTSAKEYHVSKKGEDSNKGSLASPFQTIAAAVQHAFPGDTITVHEGVYREWINPARGGKSNSNRIVYRASPGEKVAIKGSEIIKTWENVKGGIWKVTIPDSFFGEYNPFKDSVHGDWFHSLGRAHHTGDVFLNERSLYEMGSLQMVMEPVINRDNKDTEGQMYTWYCENTDDQTTIWANFQQFNPNKELVEISVRKTCFFPTKKGINYITISGFHFSQAATQWAAPTAEQVGMVSTHWNKGWIIENNIISESRCSGITLGKDRSTGHNVWSNDAGNINRDGNIHYIEVIFRVSRNNWNKEHIGSHVVRGNTIYNCEQAGICGSMGAIFSTIENNHIYNINVKSQFKGWEIAGIKIHAPVDVILRNNRIHDCERGIWLDWMAQGARVTGNLLYRNKAQDVFIEVNHGPYIVDNNLFMSKVALSNWSQGGAYIHNLFLGNIESKTVADRFTPYFLPHSTEIAGLTTIYGGDDRFYNNIFAWENGENDIAYYDSTRYNSHIQGNVYVNGIKPSLFDTDKVVVNRKQDCFYLIEAENEVTIDCKMQPDIEEQKQELISSELLGKTKVSKSTFVDPDNNEITFNKDYFGIIRGEEISAGPFVQDCMQKNGKIVVWPKEILLK